MENVHRGGTSLQERQSNLELLRIFAMLSIVAHHYVVNSGITALYDINNVTLNMVFLQIWGMWGKSAINVFVLISGYFMCKSNLTGKRLFKLILEIYFYKVLLFPILVVAGYQTVSIKEIINTFLSIFRFQNRGFTASFMTFYVFIPFYNKFIHSLNRHQHEVLLLMLLAVFTGTGTLLSSSAFNEVSWYMTLYFIAAYLRIYPNKITESCKINGILFATSIVLSWLSILSFDLIHLNKPYYFLADSHKILAVALSISAFLFFKNFRIPYNKTINRIAASTFGVLMIHANSDAMRLWLWKDFLKVPGMYEANLSMLIFHALVSMLGVFLVCTVIDMVRITLLEKPLMKWLTIKFPAINKSIFPCSEN